MKRWSAVALAILLVCALYGLAQEHIFADQLWSAEGARRFAGFAAIFWIVAGTLAWLAPRWLVPAAGAFVLAYSAWWCGWGAPMAVLYLLASSYLLGRFLYREAPGVVPLLLGLAVWIFLISLAVHFPVNTHAAYVAAFAIPFALEARRFKAYLVVPRLPPISRATAFSIAGLLFVLLIEWLAALFPEASADGLAMHLTIPAWVAQHALWSFDYRLYTWAVMPMGGDWAFTAAYLMGGSEFACKLLNFAVLVVIAVAIARVTRRPLAAALFVSTPLVYLVTGSMFVENIWAALVLGGVLELARYVQKSDPRDLLVAAVLGGAALGSKFGTLAFFVPAVAVGVLFALRRKQAAKLALASLLFTVFALPPYWNAWRATGNPLFPFLNTIFRSPYFNSTTPFADARFQVHFNWHTFFDITFRSPLFYEGRAGGLGFQYFLLVIPALFLLRRGNSVFTIAAAVGLAGAALAFFFQPNLRYLYPALPLLSIAIARVVPRPALIALIALNLVFLRAADWYHADFTLLTHAEERRYVRESMPQRELIDQLNRTARGEPVAFFGGNPIAGLDAPAYSDSWHSNNFVEALKNARLPKDVAAIFAARGIRHAIAPPPGEIIFPTVRQFLGEYAETEGQAGRYSLLRVFPAPKPIDRSPVPAGEYDDSDPRIEYEGAWLHDTQFTEPVKGSITYSSSPGDSLRFHFHGSGIEYVYTMALNRGTAQILVDGKRRARIDLYSKETLWRQHTSFANLAEGDHTIEIRVLRDKNPRSSGQYVDLDEFVVAP